MGVFKMKYCVVKDTTKVIDGSGNSAETMLQNAQNAGFTENQIEILTEEEYLTRVENEPKPLPLPTAEERLEALEMVLLELL